MTRQLRQFIEKNAARARKLFAANNINYPIDKKMGDWSAHLLLEYIQHKEGLGYLDAMQEIREVCKLIGQNLWVKLQGKEREVCITSIFPKNERQIARARKEKQWRIPCLWSASIKHQTGSHGRWCVCVSKLMQRDKNGSLAYVWKPDVVVDIHKLAKLEI